jgi:hypothetical protein
MKLEIDPFLEPRNRGSHLISRIADDSLVMIDPDRSMACTWRPFPSTGGHYHA